MKPSRLHPGAPTPHGVKESTVGKDVLLGRLARPRELDLPRMN